VKNAPALRKRLNLSIIKALPPRTTLWDSELRGFCARRQSSPTVSYLVKTRIDGRTRWFTIGRHGQPWSPETARKQALRILADPRNAGQERLPAGQNLSTAMAAFLASHGPKLKPHTLVDYRRLSDNRILPALGRLSVEAVARADVSRARRTSPLPCSPNS
jgi:hypothetical protein